MPGITPEELSRVRRLRRMTKLALAGLWSAAFLGAFAASVEDSPVAVSRVALLNLRAVLPQGWSFFTRSPREPNLLLYQRESAGPWTLVNRRGADLRFFFGIDRRGRLLLFEIGHLAGQVRQAEWVHVEEPSDNLPTDPPPAVRVVNYMRAPRLCGHFVALRQGPVPWAWARDRARIHMPYEVVHLEVTCPRDPMRGESKVP